MLELLADLRAAFVGLHCLAGSKSLAVNSEGPILAIGSWSIGLCGFHVCLRELNP